MAGKAAPLETLGIDAARLRRIAGSHDKGRQILQENAAHRRDAVGADAHELMYHREAAENSPIADLHVTGQLRVVGKNGLVADLTIVRQMPGAAAPRMTATSGVASRRLAA